MRALFTINGFGLGNSTRCYALIEELAQRGVECHVLTSGNGLKFFADKPEITSLRSTVGLTYESRDGRLSLGRTLRSGLAQVGRLVEKRRILERAVAELNPHIAIIDSEYITAPFKHRAIPVVALNNSHFLVHKFARRPKPSGVRAHFWFIEFCDYLFHRLVPDLVLCPTPTLDGGSGKFRYVGLIVRKLLQEAAPRSPNGTPNAVYLSGGSSLSAKLGLNLEQAKIQVAESSNDWKENLRRAMAADYLIINGGWSSVSEALTLGKPTLVVPLPGHSEQYFNAMLTEEWKFGLMATPDSAGEQLNKLLTFEAPCNLELVVDGASRAAEEILNLLAQKSSSQVMAHES